MHDEAPLDDSLDKVRKEIQESLIQSKRERLQDEFGTVMATITWSADHEPQQIEAFFRLQPSPYGGWDVVHTSLLDDLLAVVRT